MELEKDFDQDSSVDFALEKNLELGVKHFDLDSFVDFVLEKNLELEVRHFGLDENLGLEGNSGMN